MAKPSVTIVVSPRERFNCSRRSLESIYRNTDYPFELVYVDGNSPAPVRQYLQQAATDRCFRLIRADEFLSPNRARNIGLEHVRTKYVAFLDNDVDVEVGWLAHLVACAEETGAWAVSPVYFEGAPKDRVIHMAGGRAEFAEANGVRAFHEEHLFNQAAYDEVAPTLRRAPTGFFEFHCVLLTLDVLKRVGPLDEAYLSLHEHMDLSLLIRQAGGIVYLVPDAHVTYTFGLLDESDAEYARLRWSDDWNRRSTLHFARKWGIGEHSAWAASSISWGNGHREHLERMRRRPASMLKRAAKSVLPTRVYASLRQFRN